MMTLTHKSRPDFSWQDDNNIDDFFVLVSGSYFYAHINANKLKSITALLRGILLVPIRFVFLCAAIFVYFFVAIIARLIIIHRIHKVTQIKKVVQSKIQDGTASIEKLRISHAKVKTYLDRTAPVLKKLEGEPIMRPKLQELVNEVKLLEQTERIAAYPSDNEFVLTYDELKELNELTDLSV